MPELVTMPKYGMTMETGSVARWCKAEGDPVRKGDPLMQVEADKAVMEVESELEGVLLRILVRENVEVPCGEPLAWIGRPEEEIPRNA